MKVNLNTNNNIFFASRIAYPKHLPADIKTKIVSGVISKHFVPTPMFVVDRMIAELGKINPSDKILEPSAGYGHIAERLVQESSLMAKNIEVVEPVEEFRTILRDKGFTLVGKDIMEYSENDCYDKIIMNPPFDNGLDILHLLKCFDLLKKGGKLVAVLPEHAFIKPRQDGYEKWVRDWLKNGERKEINQYLFDLLSICKSKVIKCGSAFKYSDVPDDVKTRIVVIEK